MKHKKIGMMYFGLIFLGLICMPFSEIDFIGKLILSSVFVIVYFCLLGELFLPKDSDETSQSVKKYLVKSVLCSLGLVCSLYGAHETYVSHVWVALLLSAIALFFVLLGPSIVLNVKKK